MKNVSKKLAVLGLGLALSLSTLGARPASAAPTDVKDVDQPARKPYVMGFFITTDPSAPPAIEMVPRGSRFVIEYVSAFCNSLSTMVPPILQVEFFTNNLQTQHFFPTTPFREGLAALSSQMTRIYAESNTHVSAAIMENTFEEIECQVILTGHLVSLR
jgi:hypothetical protein